jgi:hypothetical protein
VSELGSIAVTSNIERHVAAIRLCLDNHLRMPALALIYCGIDVFASLSRPASCAAVTSSHFIYWAERDMECEKLLKVSSIDLYAARCGILHTYIMDSSLSRKGRSRRIIYAWGDKNAEEPTKLLQELGFSEVMIKIEALFSAFLHGIDVFANVLMTDQGLAALVTERGRKLFLEQASFPWPAPGLDDTRLS